MPDTARTSPAPDPPWSESPRPSQPLPPHHDATPPTGTPAALLARPLQWPEVVDRIVDTVTRRGLRVLIGYWTFRLQSMGKLDATAALVLIVCAVGVEAAMRAWRERKPATAAAVALPVLLAGLGELARFAPLTHAAGYAIAAMMPFAGAIRRL